MKKQEIVLEPYNRNVTEAVYSVLFYADEHTREDGLFEIPSASLQLLVSALELVRWELHGDERDTFTKAIGIAEHLRDEQKRREWKREDEEQRKKLHEMVANAGTR